MKFAFNLFISRRTSSVTGRTISSGTFSSGSSIADANGCRSSGLHDKGVTYKFDVEGGVCCFTAYQVSCHNQSIAEHFEQKCRSDDARFSSGVPRPLSTALYILFHPYS